MQINFKNWLPHIIAVASFIIIPLIYFLPLLQGKVVFQSDIINFLGVSKEIFDFRAKFHAEPLWTNSMFGGMPAFQVSAEYPANLVQYIFNFLLHFIPFPASSIFIFCFGFYILLQVLKVDPYVSIIGSLAYGFSSFFFIILSVGHNSEANAMSFAAPVLAGVILIFNGKRLLGGALTALAFALEFYSGHLQITYYLMLLLGIYGITELVVAIKKKQIPAFFISAGVLGIATFLAVSTNITTLWLTYKYGTYSTRGKSDLTFQSQNKSGGLTIDYATQWCYGVPETMTLMIPNYVGGASEPIASESKSALEGIDPQMQQNVAQYEQYWGDQPVTSGPVYVGAIICFFALLGFLIIKGPFKWFLLIATILSIMLSWGKNFMSFFEIFFYHFPGFNKFRSVSMILVIAELTLPLIAALAIDRIIKDPSFFTQKIKLRFLKEPQTGMKLFLAALIVTGGFSLLCFIMPGTFSSFHKANELDSIVQAYKQGNPNVPNEQLQAAASELLSAVEQARKKVFTSDAIRSAIFILLAGGLMFVYYKKWADKKVIIGVLVFFLLMDMYNVDKRYLNDRNFSSKKSATVPYEPDQADEQILQDTSLDYRVFNTTQRPDQDSRTSYFHKSLGGYSGVKMKRYDELLNLIETANMSVIDMLNAKYFIVGGRGGERRVEKNPDASGNAWFVNNYKLVPNADSEYTNLNHFNPKQTAIVNEKFSGYLANVHLNSDSSAQIRMISYQPNDLVYTSQSHSQGLAVFSEIYYKDGWNAFIDGAPADYIQTDYVLRAILIPAGTHKIEFKFQPKEYAIGEKISLASSLILLLGCISILVLQFRKPQE
jgi:hypothetical protein